MNKKETAGTEGNNERKGTRIISYDGQKHKDKSSLLRGSRRFLFQKVATPALSTNMNVQRGHASDITYPTLPASHWIAINVC